MISRSTIAIFVIIFALLGLLLGVAASSEPDNSEENASTVSDTQLGIQDRVEINVTNDEAK